MERTEETSKVIEGLLNLLSQLFTQSCRNSLKHEKQSFNSLDQMSCENQTWTKEQTQRVLRGDSVQQASYQQLSLAVGSQVKEKLLELEQKVKSQSTHVSQLEATLENLISPKEFGET